MNFLILLFKQYDTLNKNGLKGTAFRTGINIFGLKYDSIS